MTLHLGAVPASSTLYIPFATYDSSDGSSITMTGLAATDIEIYKNGSATQRSSDAGYALLDTDGIDFDGITGIHGFSIDLSDNTDAGFFSVGGFYWVVVSSVTVDSQTVNFIAATFRIVAAEAIAGKPKVDVDAWLGTAAATPSVAGVPEVDLTHVGGATTNVAALATNVNDILTDTADMQPKLGTPSDLGDGADLAGNLVSISDKSDALLERVVGLIGQSQVIGATGNDTTHIHMSTETYGDDEINDTLIAFFDVSDAEWHLRWVEDYDSASQLATVATLPFTPNQGHGDYYHLVHIRRDTAPTGASLRSGLGMASANLDTQIADIEGKVDDLETRLGTPSDLGSGATVAANLADIEGFADSIPTDVWANGTRTLTAIDEDSTTLDLDATIRGAVGLAAADLDTQLAALPTAAENADAVWDEAATGHTDAGKAGEQLWTDLDAVLVDTGTTLQAELDGIQADTEDIQSRLPAALVNSRMDATIDGTGMEAAAVAAIADGVWDEATTSHTTSGTFGEQVKTDIDAILADTNELQTDDYPTSIAAVKSDTAAILTDTAEIGAAGAGLTALATQASVNTIDDLLDTELPALTTEVGKIPKSDGTSSWNATALAAIQGEANDALVAYDPPTNAELTTAQGVITALLPAALTGDGNMKVDVLAISGDTTAADRLEALMDGIIVAQVNDAGASTTSFVADGFTEATNDHFNGRLITFLTGALAGQQTAITDYVGATQTLTVTALTEAPANDDYFIVH